jgi:peptidoglycan/LPS O-acetylase OafA/YrhL
MGAPVLAVILYAGIVSSRDSRRHIVGIDLMRFLAATLVLFFHYGFWAATGEGLPTDPRLQPFCWFGWVGVEIFFLISGFVIASSAQSATPGRFVRSRLVRLYPAAWICATVTFLLRVHAEPRHSSVLEWLHSVFLYPGFGGPFIDGSYATLPAELSFYTLVCLLLCAGRYRWLEPLMYALALVSLGFCIAELHPGMLPAPVAHALFFSERSEVNTNMLLLRHGVFFALGSLLWTTLMQRATPTRVVMIGACVVGGLLEIAWKTVSIDDVAHAHLQQWAPMAAWIASLLLLVCSVRWADRVRQLLGDRMSRVARTLGLMTYPLYLIHQRVGFYFIRGLQQHMSPLAAVFVTTAAMFVLAGVIATWLEPRLQRAMANLLGAGKADRKPAEQPAASLP